MGNTNGLEKRRCEELKAELRVLKRLQQLEANVKMLKCLQQLEADIDVIKRLQREAGARALAEQKRLRLEAEREALSIALAKQIEVRNEAIAKAKEVKNQSQRGRCDQGETDRRTNNLLASIRSEFDRISSITKAGVKMEIQILDGVLWITFSRDKVSKSLEIPLPTITEKGLEFIQNGDVIRALCDFWLEREQKRLNFHEVVNNLLCEDVNTIMPAQISGSPLIHKIVKSFDRNQVAYMVNCTQKLINQVVNSMPLHETDMNSWAMNHRLIIIDPAFNAIRDPNERLNYQVEKNKKYYESFGWTAIGLSDGVLADKNVILTTNIRDLAPFSEYHNPQRNLYSTLGMKGDEEPRIRSKCMQDLMDKGIIRKGWNLVTAILDTPLNFEDQILVDNSLRNLSHKITRRFTIYGTKVRVKKGDKVKVGEILGFADDNQPIKMNLRCDRAVVSNIRKEVSIADGDPVDVAVISVEATRFLRDGSKFSNCHGNKGIIRFTDLGYEIDPRTGDERKIEVMMSGDSVNRRKNFGQLAELITNKLNPGKEPIVVENDYFIEKIKLEEMLKSSGFPKDGTSMVDTYCGEHSAIVGEIFWGVTKDPEDQLWDEDKTDITNNRELRTSGLKFSHVEMKALTTRFGTKNPLLKEILSHSQGVEILQDEIKILKSVRGELPSGYPVIDAKDVGYVDTSQGILHTIDEIKSTIVDDEYMPEGFILRLPCYFQAIVEKEDLDQFVMGMPQEVQNPESKIEYIYNSIFIPNSLLRRCWRHGSGKWGLNTIGLYVNNIIASCHKFIETGDVNDEFSIMRGVARYFINIARAMGSKTGELNTYGMAVRYPMSVRATAALSDDLPKNTLEIHREMANKLKVKSNDVVIAERFPCLGFMSIRPQYVKVTDDPQCKYVIRSSGNSLCSMNLDFDGDTLFLASFSDPNSIEVLRREMKNPNKLCEAAIEQTNAKKVPVLKEMSLDDFDICRFPKPNNEEHAELVRKATGVKSHTGPVIALAYNLMRIVEKNVPYNRTEEHVNLELLLDFLGNTVFKQKHGIKSLQEEATDAICTANVDEMVNLGFDRQPSQLLCDLIRKEAAATGIRDVVSYHKFIKENGGSKIINRIVRMKNKIYFATRAQLGPFKLLDHLREKAVDLPSFMMAHILRSEREKIEDKIDRLKAGRMKIRNILGSVKMYEIYKKLSNYIDEIMVKSSKNV